MKKIIGIDIGGTMIKYSLVTECGKILEKNEIDTEAEKGIDNLFENISKIIETYLSDKIIGVGISATGQIDSTIGKVIGGNPIIPGWVGTNLVEKIEERFKLPSVLENDVNSAAIGEKWLGAGKNIKDFICVTIGTGVGGGIILNDKLYSGNDFVAGEFGHIQIVKNGIPCSCGKAGCYEKYASMTALINDVFNKLGKKMNGYQIFELLKNGDKEIEIIIKKWIDYITDGLSNIIYSFNPNLIIIGGGVTKQGDYLLDTIKDDLYKKLGTNFKKNLDLKFASLGNDAGILGACYLLLKKLNKL